MRFDDPTNDCQTQTGTITAGMICSDMAMGKALQLILTEPRSSINHR